MFGRCNSIFMSVHDAVKIWIGKTPSGTCRSRQDLFHDLERIAGRKIEKADHGPITNELERQGHGDTRYPGTCSILFANTKAGGVCPDSTWIAAGGIPGMNRSRQSYYVRVPAGSHHIVRHWERPADPIKSKQESNMTTKSSYREMPYAEWVALPEWPAQRNTPAHATRILRSGTFDPNHPTLGQHCAAVTLGGVTYKVNGITTTYLAEQGKCKFPVKVRVLHFYCDTKDEAHKIYLSFDAPWQVKGAKDRFHSAFRVHSIAPKSTTFQKDKGTSALIWTYNALRGHKSNSMPVGMMLETVVQELKPTLIEIDDMIVGAKGVPTTSTPALTVMMLTHRKVIEMADPDKRQKALNSWRLFWGRFVESRGGTGDASLAYNKLWHWIEVGLQSGRKQVSELIEAGLFAYGKRNDKDGCTRKGHVDITTYHNVQRLMTAATGGFTAGDGVNVGGDEDWMTGAGLGGDPLKAI